MEPFITLMRRYAIDCADCHDQSVYEKYNEIMAPEYLIHMSGLTMRRDEDFKPAVRLYFAQMPGLCLAIHDIVTNGNRLAMLFSEHGGSLAHEGRLSAWGVIGLYKWNGQRLTEVWVEQDYLSHFEQLETGKPQPLEPIHLDPWLIRSVPANPANEEIVRSWLLKGDLYNTPSAVFDDSWITGSAEPTLTPVGTQINDLFSAGDRVPFHISQSGRYRGGIKGLDDQIGREAVLHIAGVATVRDNRVSHVRAITDQWGMKTRLLQHEVKAGDFSAGPGAEAGSA